MHYITAIYFLVITVNYIWIAISFPGYTPKSKDSFDDFEAWYDSKPIQRTKMEDISAAMVINTITFMTTGYGVFRVLH